MPIMNTFTTNPAIRQLGNSQWCPDRQGQNNPNHQQGDQQDQNHDNKLPLTAKQLGTSVLQAGLTTNRQTSSPELLHTPPRNQAVEAAIHALLQPGYNSKSSQISNQKNSKQATHSRLRPPNH